jgi:hypothetical protein
VIAEKRNEQFSSPVLKNKSKIAIAEALEELVSQSSDAETAVHMRLAKTIDQVA